MSVATIRDALDAAMASAVSAYASFTALRDGMKAGIWTAIATVIDTNTKGYLFAINSVDQPGMITNTVVNFDTNLGSQAVTLSSNQFTLEANKTYFLMAGLRFDFPNLLATTVAAPSWWDVDGAAFIGAVGPVRPAGSSSTLSTLPIAAAVFTTTAVQEVELRIGFASNPVTGKGTNMFAFVKEL